MLSSVEVPEALWSPAKDSLIVEPIGYDHIVQNWYTFTPEEKQHLNSVLIEHSLLLGAGFYTMDFCTLGMFIIDEIHFPPPDPPVHGIIGGAGAYAALGARIVQGNKLKHLISWTIHVGKDFPDDIRKQIEEWGTTVNWIDTKNRLTTRALNKYGPNEQREFEYLTPKIRVDETQLTERQLLAKCYHLICAPARCIDLVTRILDARKKIKESNKLITTEENNMTLKPMDPPLFVWEPVPDSCTPTELPNVLKALKYVDVISPNHHELKMLFGETDADPFLACELAILERQCNELLTSGFGKKTSAVVVRRGERGCYVASDTRHSWLPAYHRPKDELHSKKQKKWIQRVVDPTGGGNAFLGGFCVGLLVVKPIKMTHFEEAAICGSIAASFAIEQVGMPSVSFSSDGVELWNGENQSKRREKFEKRLLKLEKLKEEERVKSSLYRDTPTTFRGKDYTRTDRTPADGVQAMRSEPASKR